MNKRKSGRFPAEGNLPIIEPTVVLLNVELLWRADPNEQGPDLLDALASLVKP